MIAEIVIFFFFDEQLRAIITSVTRDSHIDILFSRL